MRHYHRVSYRHLDDSERYRDHDYLGDDGWVGPNERVPDGDALRGQARDDGAEPDGDDYDGSSARSPELTHRLEYPREGFTVDPRTQQPLAEARAARAQGGLRDIIRHPGSFVRRMVSGLLRSGR